jgi:hypothetical protein
LLTLLKRPKLAGHTKSFQIAASIASEKPGFIDPWEAEGKDENEEGADESEPPMALSIEDPERQQCRNQAVRDDYQALLPPMENIIKTTWPNLADTVPQSWLGHINTHGDGFDHLLALIVTLATNVECLDIQLPKRNVKESIRSADVRTVFGTVALWHEEGHFVVGPKMSEIRWDW